MCWYKTVTLLHSRLLLVLFLRHSHLDSSPIPPQLRSNSLATPRFPFSAIPHKQSTRTRLRITPATQVTFCQIAQTVHRYSYSWLVKDGQWMQHQDPRPELGPRQRIKPPAVPPGRFGMLGVMTGSCIRRLDLYPELSIRFLSVALKLNLHIFILYFPPG